VSEISITLESSNEDVIGPDVSIVTDVYMNWTDLPSNLLVTPISHFPIVLVYNIPDTPTNATLRLDANIIAKLLTNSSITLGDPILTSLNPWLEDQLPIPLSFVLVETPDPINQLIIDYIFPMYSSSAGSAWTNIHIINGAYMEPDYPSVISLISSSSYMAGFVPLPYVYEIDSPNLGIATFVVNGEDLNPLANYTVELEEIGYGHLKAYVPDEPTNWPLNLFAYITIYQNATSCQETTTLARFFYWTLGNPVPLAYTALSGFEVFSNEIYDALKENLKLLECSGKLVLTYDDLSKHDRSKVLLGISIGGCVLSVLLLLGFWVSDENRRSPSIMLHSSVLLLGIIFSLVGFILWWLPPTNSSICLSRYWFISLGYLFVVSSVIVYTFAYDFGMTAKDIETASLTFKHASMVHLSLFFIEVVLLIIYTFVEDPIGSEIVTDAFDWKARDSCTLKHETVDLVNFAYFLAVALYGVYVIYKHWNTHNLNLRDATRWLAASIFVQLVTNLLMIIFSASRSLQDDQYYIFIVTCVFLTEMSCISLYCISHLPKNISSMTATLGGSTISSVTT
jgi:hypothetical protein